MQYNLNNSGTLGFCPLKIKITQFHGDSVLIPLKDRPQKQAQCTLTWNWLTYFVIDVCSTVRRVLSFVSS